MVMASESEVLLCDSCDLDYFYVIANLCGNVFPGDKRFAAEFGLTAV